MLRCNTPRYNACCPLFESRFGRKLFFYAAAAGNREGNSSDDITLLKLIMTNVMVFLLQISGVDGNGSGYDTDRNRNRLLKEEGR